MNENNITNVTELLSKPWQKFLAKFKEIENLPIPEWKEPQLLGYFCKRYEKYFENKFALSFRGAPSKCNEIYMIKKVMAMLDTTDPEIVHQYIDWVFDCKIIPSKIKIRSIGFLTTPGFGNEFNVYRNKKIKIIKSTELPIKYQQLADTLNLPVSTYGDLAFIKMALDQTKDSEARAPYKKLFNNLIAIGFEPNVLNNL
jgi:hypothetical protein